MSAASHNNHFNRDSHGRFELKTIVETGRMLIESNDLDFILNNLLLILMGKLVITRGAILLYHPTENQYEVKRKKGPLSFSEGDMLELQISDELKDQPVIDPAELPPENQLGSSSNFLLFNLRTSDHHLGFLYVGPKINRERLKDREREFVESLTLMSSVAISNSRMFDELKRTNRKLDRKVYELKTLFELSKDFNMMVDRDQIASTFKFAMLGQLLIRKFFFFLDTGNQRQMISSSGITEELGTEQIERLWNLKQEVTVVDEKLYEQIPFLKRHKIEAVIGLHFQNQKMAVVGIGDRASDEPFSESDFDFIHSMGNLALLSIQKTFLLEERIEKERMEEELEIARSIQRGLLPSPLPTIEHLDLHAETIASQQVGGDFFDIIKSSEDRHLLTIGDVSGKGVPAALLMANLQAILRALKPFDISMSRATAYMNDIIHENTPSDKFITFFWGAFQSSNRTLTYVNAGHNAPILMRADENEPVTLDEGGLILGAMPTMTPYEENQISLQSGDLLIFYTDGITEAMNPDDEEFGKERLMQCIKKHRSAAPRRLYDAILEDINEFTGQRQSDDLTLVILRVN